MRIDGRASDESRKALIVPGYQAFAEGSALISMGQTKVLCAATVEERVPPFLRSTGSGWVTAEYAMLPRSTISRTSRTQEGRPTGRSSEIQRLIGRSLRAVTDMALLGERTILIDCDVLQADGGTRTAAITGSYVALYQALLNLVRNGVFEVVPLKSSVAAISVGLVDKAMMLDMCYEEDARAQVDFNVVMTDRGEYVELQGTAEKEPFSQDNMDSLLTLARQGIGYLLNVQREAVQAL